MGIEKASAITIIVGSVFFLAAAFSPVSRIFGIRDADQKLEIITAASTQWQISQLLFALGAIVTVIGIALLAYRLAGQSYSVYLTTSSSLMAVGAALWSWHVYLRAVDPALFTAGEIPLWLFATYSLLTMAGLALLGTALLQMPLPGWVGWLCIGSAGVFLVLALIFGDMPPFVYYLVTLTVGIKILRTVSTQVSLASVPV